MSGREEKILVLVRLRPLSEKEIGKSEVADWECINDSTILYRNSLQERSGLPTAYSFDRVFSGECSTRQVYEEATKEIALSVVSGINSSIFAYGQTSSGKTYTMNGITEYTVADIYDYILRHDERAFALKFSAMEIYNENVRDLLSSNNTTLRILDDPEKGTIVEKLTEETLADLSHLKKLLSICEAQRKIGETSLNEQSSRSHQILKLTIESSAREFIGKGKSSTLSASVFFIDLAGSERASQAMSAGSRLKEGCHINRSLLTLGNVIRKLSKGRQGHINYRDSKLTRILQPCLGGNARTSIICTLSPARSHVEQSKNTLLFASCAKEVKTNAQVNVVMSDKALVKHLKKELARLESELKAPAPISLSCNCSVILRKKDLQLEKMEKEIRELTKQRDLAQSRIEDLLQLISNDHSPDKLERHTNHNNSKSHDKWEDEYSVSESSLNIHHVEDAINSIDINNQCKEVRCIELEDSRTDTNGVHTHISHNGCFSYNTLEQRVQDVQRSINSLTSPYPNDNAACALGSRSLDLTRSRSCRSSIASEVSKRAGKISLQNNSVNAARLSRNGSVSSLGTDVGDDLKSQSSKNVTDEEISCVQTFVANLKNAKVQYEKQLRDEQVRDEMRRTIRDAGLDPTIDEVGNTLDLTLQFEKLQRAILVLWQCCNVSLVHRTYFFLLFKDDPNDSVYMEVELRRLSFLKETFSQGDQTLALSEKALRKEREMLSKLVNKRFSNEERKKLYQKWDIGLESKRRRLQLISKLWSTHEDIDHVLESATIVGKLVKFSDHKCALKGMFGLSFSPPGLRRRSYGWIGRRASLT